MARACSLSWGPRAEELDVSRPGKWALDPVFEKRKERGIPTFKEAAAKVYAATYKTWRNI